jgi:multiple antibiotic resistance protein
MTGFLASTFVTLVLVVDPLGLVPSFISITHGLPERARRDVALRAAFIAATILAGSALIGDWLLRTLAISLPAFRIAGGLLLFSIASEMVFGLRIERQSRQAEEALEEHVRNIAAFPLAIPLMAGPGAITATVLLAGRANGAPAMIAILLAVIAIVLALCFGVFALAARIAGFIGATGNVVLSRLLGVILAALAVQYIVDGVRDFGIRHVPKAAARNWNGPIQRRIARCGASCPGQAASEGDLVVHVGRLIRAGKRWLELARSARTGRAEVIAPSRSATGAVEHSQLRVEALQHDLGGVAFLPVLVLPFARLQRAFQINLRAFLEILLGDLAEAFIEDHYAMPFSLLTPLASRSVTPALRRRHPQIRDRTAVLGPADFWVGAEITDEDHFVDATCHDTLRGGACLLADKGPLVAPSPKEIFSQPWDLMRQARLTSIHKTSAISPLRLENTTAFFFYCKI